MTVYDALKKQLRRAPRRWLVTGAAGFIGSNLVEVLLKLDQRVVGLDNFSTGYHRNLKEVQARLTPAQWQRFHLITGDIGDLPTCRRACDRVDYVLHQAALGSVPASMTDPLGCHRSNVTGFLNMLVAARDARARRLVYASSSAVYGDAPGLPKVENNLGRVLSPYAASKAMDELYADVFGRAYGFESIGLRYFNVFGPRQDPAGAYAAVIPKWIDALLAGERVRINGDGRTTRDFCYIENVVQANLLAATTPRPEAVNQVYNIAFGRRTTLNSLLKMLRGALATTGTVLGAQAPVFGPFRAGDVRHSLADIGKAKRLLGYEPTHSIEAGLALAMDWYRGNQSRTGARGKRKRS
ncbi:MAG TPA: SDR family oxidoreductase [Verrucomicrobiae bacterium]|nr:SDR family oxidoreductase [Verrucomicrobiae bacterium]